MVDVLPPPGFMEGEWQAYVEKGRRLVKQIGDAKFELGDTLVEMLDSSERQGDVERIVEVYAEQIGARPSTLLNYRYVSRAWPPSMRRSDVSWSVHARLAAEPDRFHMIREEPQDPTDPDETVPWTQDEALRARQLMPVHPKTPDERIDKAKHILRDTDEAAAAIAQLAERTEVIEAVVENPRFRNAVREANRQRGKKLEERAGEARALAGLSEPPSRATSQEGPLARQAPAVDYRDTPSAVLKILGLATSFCVSMQNAVVLLQTENCDETAIEAVTDSMRKVRAICDWCDHVATTGKTDMDAALAEMLRDEAGGEG
ncbi:DUF6192 family protein [Streptomyces sp. L-9-10]|uniref:DUF6192 family protein n=1 Tax=Streptomyces sp. L-9-10 TaxID=1478131 RepID=UPI00101BD153|nr:DUF6192 family protein [Streptomyces sp. L-9-10]